MFIFCYKICTLLELRGHYEKEATMDQVIVAEQDCMLQFLKKLRLYIELVRETLH